MVFDEDIGESIPSEDVGRRFLGVRIPGTKLFEVNGLELSMRVVDEVEHVHHRRVDVGRLHGRVGFECTRSLLLVFINLGAIMWNQIRVS